MTGIAALTVKVATTYWLHARPLWLPLTSVTNCFRAFPALTDCTDTLRTVSLQYCCDQEIGKTRCRFVKASSHQGNQLLEGVEVSDTVCTCPFQV